MSPAESDKTQPGKTEPGSAPLGPHLVIDGASDDVTAAVVAVTNTGEQVLAERRWTVAEAVAPELLGGVSEVLAEARLDLAALVAVVVDVGPGRYGGLRASVAAAQGIALARDLPLAPVARFEAAALPYLEPGGPTVVAVHAPGRGRIGWAAYASADRIGDGPPEAPPRVIEAARMDPIEQAIETAPSGARWCGELPAEVLDVLHVSDPTAQRVTEPESGTSRRAIDLVRLARLHRAYTAPELVDALYLRPPSITRPKGQAITRPKGQAGSGDAV